MREGAFIIQLGPAAKIKPMLQKKRQYTLRCFKSKKKKGEWGSGSSGTEY